LILIPSPAFLLGRKKKSNDQSAEVKKVLPGIWFLGGSDHQRSMHSYRKDTKTD